MARVQELKPNPINPNRHPKSQIELLAKSISIHGWRWPVIVSNRSGFIVAGHGRVEAASLLGLKTVPVSLQDFATEADEHAFLLADNKIAELAELDNAMLVDILQNLSTAGMEIELAGFTATEFDALKERLAAASNSERDADPKLEQADELQALWNVQTGDVWQIGRHRLLCGDSTQPAAVTSLLEGATPSIMVTDPPYGVDYNPKWRSEAGINKNKGKMGVVINDGRADWREAWALFPGDVVYVWHAGRYASIVQASLEACDFQIRSQIVWAKDRFALSRGHYHWHHEPCWYACRGTGHWIGDRKQSTLWQIKARDDSGSGHSTQKPLECMARAIRNHSGDVYEPFAGSGTTMVAAENLGRICYAIELHPPYCAVILNRMKTAFPELQINRVHHEPAQ